MLLRVPETPLAFNMPFEAGEISLPFGMNLPLAEPIEFISAMLLFKERLFFNTGPLYDFYPPSDP